ncbi:hypothetical protein E1292_02985 [Nonomuraea deserti]|uniref:Uncharacterized protein n=1 Tax=Nonomuraea deserti TaxID=1848322 RepID=A0A4R4W5A6_9ACTN|nr:hypothetical protein E1292_02985 [Nonomuraea deserti]
MTVTRWPAHRVSATAVTFSGGAAALSASAWRTQVRIACADGWTPTAAAPKVSAPRGGHVTLAAAADAFLATPRTANPNTHRASSTSPGTYAAGAALWRRPAGRSRAARPGRSRPHGGRRGTTLTSCRPGSTSRCRMPSNSEARTPGRSRRLRLSATNRHKADPAKQFQRRQFPHPARGKRKEPERSFGGTAVPARPAPGGGQAGRVIPLGRKSDIADSSIPP